MFEAVTDALALACCVLQKDSKFPQRQPAARKLETFDARANPVSFASSSRAAGMNHQIIDPKQQRAFNFFAK